MYKVNNQEFKTKKDVKDYCKSIVENNKYKVIEGDDFDFIKDLIKWHDHYALKVNKLVSMTSKHNKQMYSTLCIFLKYEDGTEDDLSYIHCINNLQKEKTFYK
jgi:hypothetical protein